MPDGVLTDRGDDPGKFFIVGRRDSGGDGVEAGGKLEAGFGERVDVFLDRSPVRNARGTLKSKFVTPPASSRSRVKPVETLKGAPCFNCRVITNSSGRTVPPISAV